MMWEVLKGIVEKIEAFGVIVIMEAWTTTLKKKDVMGCDQPGMGQPLAKNARFSPERKEALVITWEFKMEGEEKFTGLNDWVVERIRDMVTFGEFRESHGKGTGALTNLIQ